LSTPDLFNAHTVLRQQYRERREGIPTMKTLAQLKDGDCRYTVKDHPVRKFCGKEALFGISWCECHAEKVFENAVDVIARAKAGARERQDA
jgi:hypothetical protein